MASNQLKKSIYRIVSDLVKSDSVISIDELNQLDATIEQFGITAADRIDGYSTTLADATDFIVQQRPNVIRKVLQNLQECALKDGECSRDEAMLITAIEITCDGKGKIISLPLDNRPILSSQILYVDPTYNPKKNELDKRFDEIRYFTEIAGFDLIYIPHVAASFKQHAETDSIKRLLSLINPSLDESSLINKAMSIQDMDSRFFYLQVLNGRLQMNLNFDKPVWLMRLQNSTVNGKEHANYFAYYVETGNISYQLSEFIKRLNSKLNSYSVIVNKHPNATSDFHYDGFNKALLDVMATDRIEPWVIKVYVRAGASSVVDKSKAGDKFSISISRGNKTYPIRINGREAAFYLLLLCASAGPDKGINFEYDRVHSAMIQNQYDAAYKILSNREAHTPDITLSSTLRPIKAKVMKELKDCGIKGNLHLFKPAKKELNTHYIPLPSENIKIVSSEGETLLKDSTIFKTYINIRQKFMPY